MKPPISPFKINKDSCYIKKSQHQQQRRHHPVIIYTHSPKIIHTNPRDFMELVQKLTGLSSHHHPNSNPNTNGISEFLANDEIQPNSDENHSSNCDAKINSSSSCCILPEQPIFHPPGDTSNQKIQDFGDSLNFLCSAHDPLCSNTDSFDPLCSYTIPSSSWLI